MANSYLLSSGIRDKVTEAFHANLNNGEAFLAVRERSQGIAPCNWG